MTLTMFMALAASGALATITAIKLAKVIDRHVIKLYAKRNLISLF